MTIVRCELAPRCRAAAVYEVTFRDASGRVLMVSHRCVKCVPPRGVGSNGITTGLKPINFGRRAGGRRAT